jgi:hypothetical protein
MKRSSLARLEWLERVMAASRPCALCDENCIRMSSPGKPFDSDGVECPNSGSCRLIVVRLAFDPHEPA